MRVLALTAVTIVLAGGLQLSGLAADERAAPYVEPYAVPPVHYAPRPAPAREAPEKKDEKRGNTPPGMDRTGGGPASGAILDPTGAVTKEPVLRER